jgi:hypothetical protein
MQSRVLHHDESAAWYRPGDVGNRDFMALWWSGDLSGHLFRVLSPARSLISTFPSSLGMLTILPSAIKANVPPKPRTALPQAAD